eukprot:TRINITY_DN11212_c0_g1_i6.p1 TRINITY_DN11212_c0_g1~~TRINITY_DN11212_c0_g1_i6.p1  ORF type:complete len:266 (+),score=82.57 TRINITY_DN11212_c0_g1_i6:322-1119(+)
MGGGMGSSGLDPMALLALSQNGIGGGDLSSLMMGNPASLMAQLIGGEGARDPSKGIENMLGLGTALGGIDDAEDLDGDGEADHLVETRNKIDDYLAKQWLLGKRKLTVSVNYGNMPLEYQYLNQYHGFPNPLVGTPMGPRFGLPGPSPMPQRPQMPHFGPPPPPPQHGGYGPPHQGGYGPPPPPPGYGPPPPPPGYGPQPAHDAPHGHEQPQYPQDTQPQYPQQPQPHYPQPPSAHYPPPPSYPQPQQPQYPQQPQAAPVEEFKK